MRIIFLLLAAFIISSCNDVKHIKLSNDTKEFHSNFWNSFQDPQLNSLIEEALQANHNILLSIVNVAKARARLDNVQADKFPNITASLSTNRSKYSENNVPPLPGKPYNSFDMSMFLNYQIDIWEKVANANKSALEQLLSLESTKKTVEITVASEVAKVYFNILALDQKIKINQELLALNKEFYNLKDRLFKEGFIDEIELHTANSQLQLSHSQLLSIDQQLSEQEAILAILLGRNPEDKFIRNKKIQTLVTPLKLPKFLPSKLLQQRPDIMAAEADLKSAKYQVAIARAQYFPDLSLNNLIGLSSSSKLNLFDSSSHHWNLGASTLVPILDFGKIKSQIEIATATQEQYLILYKNTVNTAFGEAITSLTNQQNSSKNLIHAQANEKSAAISNKLADQRFKAGSIDAISLIDNKKQLLSAKLNTLTATQGQLNSTIEVFKSFGGNWEQNSIN